VSEALQVLDCLEAREDLRQLRVVSYPNMKKQVREKVHRELSKRADIGRLEPRALTTAELMGVLKDGRG